MRPKTKFEWGVFILDENVPISDYALGFLSAHACGFFSRKERISDKWLREGEDKRGHVMIELGNTIYT